MAQPAIYFVEHRTDVCRHLMVMVTICSGSFVPAVIPHVEQDQFEFRQQRLPEHAVAVDRKAISVAEIKPDAVGISAAANTQLHAIRHGGGKDFGRGRHVTGQRSWTISFMRKRCEKRPTARGICVYSSLSSIRVQRPSFTTCSPATNTWRTESPRSEERRVGKDRRS